MQLIFGLHLDKIRLKLEGLLRVNAAQFQPFEPAKFCEENSACFMRKLKLAGSYLAQFPLHLRLRVSAANFVELPVQA